MFDRRSTRGTPSRARERRVLERFLAGLVLIGLLLWGASVLATPEEAIDDGSRDGDNEGPDAKVPTGTRLPDADEPVQGDDPPSDEDRDDEEEKDERRGKDDDGDNSGPG